jgi:hypothetical protein
VEKSLDIFTGRGLSAGLFWLVLGTVSTADFNWSALSICFKMGRQAAIIDTGKQVR